MTSKFSRADIESLLHDRSNWGRWGEDDQIGAVNLITPDKRVAAAGLVRDGRSVSMSREFPTEPGPSNPRPADHFMKLHPRDQGAGAMVDYIGLEYHGIVCTHLDALCHTWDERGMWNGRKPDDQLTFDGSRWGSVEKWKEGLLTRGVLLDVPAYRGEPYVTNEKPVTGAELAAIADHQGVAVGAGDALVVYSGRDQWDTEHPEWGAEPAGPACTAPAWNSSGSATARSLPGTCRTRSRTTGICPGPFTGRSSPTAWQSSTIVTSDRWRRPARNSSATSSCSFSRRC